ncbi:MAG: hypothetical protein [Caudoviricetes sp.]|nr:MAG: hypothetical protein [Caudoviricetes sp.]
MSTNLCAIVNTLGNIVKDIFNIFYVIIKWVCIFLYNIPKYIKNINNTEFMGFMEESGIISFLLLCFNMYVPGSFVLFYKNETVLREWNANFIKIIKRADLYSIILTFIVCILCFNDIVKNDPPLLYVILIVPVLKLVGLIISGMSYIIGEYIKNLYNNNLEKCKKKD